MGSGRTGGADTPSGPPGAWWSGRSPPGSWVTVASASATDGQSTAGGRAPPPRAGGGAVTVDRLARNQSRPQPSRRPTAPSPHRGDDDPDLLPGPPPGRGTGVPRRHPDQRRCGQRRHLPQAARPETGARPGLRHRVGGEPGHHPTGARPDRARSRRRRRAGDTGNGEPSLRGGALPGTAQPGGGGQHRDALDKSGADGTATFILGGQVRGEPPTSCSSTRRGTTSGPPTIGRSSRSERASTASSCWSWP